MIFLSKSLTEIFIILFYLKKTIKTANDVWSIYKILHVTPSLSYLQILGKSTMRTSMDDLATFGCITEVCYVILCGVDFNVVIFCCWYYECMENYIKS